MDEPSYSWDASPFLCRTVALWRRRFAEIALLLLASVFVLSTEPPRPRMWSIHLLQNPNFEGKVSFCIMPAVIVCDFHPSVTLSVCPTGFLVWRYFLTYLWCFQNNLKISVLAKPLQANWKKTFLDTSASNTGTRHVEDSDLNAVLELALLLILPSLGRNILLVITPFLVRGLYWGPLNIGERLLKTSTVTEAVQKDSTCYN